MRALMSPFFKNKNYAGSWVDIDTKCLFNNQYNTTEEYGNLRIFDGDIVKIEDDARIGKGKCKYCGAMVIRGNEEEHFTEMESKKANCSMSDMETKSCFWKSKRYLGETEVKKETREEIVDGVVKTINVRTMERKWIPYCSYAERETYGQPSCSCTCDEHRRMGIEWFTENNTFFLKHPDGLPSMEIKELDDKNWYTYCGGFCKKYVGEGKSKLGSYELTVELDNDNHIKYFGLANARNRYRFYRINDYYAMLDGIANSPRIVRNILDHGNRAPKVNEGIEKFVREIIDSVMVY